MVSRVLAFQVGGTGSITDGIRDFNLNPRTGCVSFIYVQFRVVFGGGPDILPTTDSRRPDLVLLSSALVYNLWLLVQASDPKSRDVFDIKKCRPFPKELHIYENLNERNTIKN